MKFFVMRHAQASYNAASDRERPITNLGIDQTNRLLSACIEDLAPVNLIWSSDLLRAKQTAALVSDKINLSVLEQSFLSPDGDVDTVLNALAALSSDTCLFMVSHQPLVGELVSCLLHGNSYQSHPYATSEILSLDLDMFELGMANLTKQYLPL